MKITSIELNPQYSMAIHQLALTSISDFSEVVTMQQTDSAAHKLKSRSFYKSAYLWVYFVDFHFQYELHLTVLSDS